MKNFCNISDDNDVVTKEYVDNYFMSASICQDTDHIMTGIRNCLITLNGISGTIYEVGFSDSQGHFVIPEVCEDITVYVEPGIDKLKPDTPLTFYIDVPNYIGGYPVYLNGTYTPTEASSEKPTRGIVISRDSNVVKGTVLRIFFSGTAFFIDTTSPLISITRTT